LANSSPIAGDAGATTPLSSFGIINDVYQFRIKDEYQVMSGVADIPFIATDSN
jgi:hypothetical protein